MTQQQNKTPRVLLLDIETSPIVGYSWGMYEQNIIKVLQPVKIICVAWKWLDEETTNCKAICDYKGYNPPEINDEELVKTIWKVLDEADVVVAHNGTSFDCKRLNARFIYHKLNAPSSYKIVDTLTVAKKYFKFDANNLNWIGTYLGEGQKVSTGGFELWEGCMAGHKPSWKKMKEYNIGDVSLLERVYLRLRPYMTNHPNMNLLGELGEGESISCPCCTSSEVSKRGFSITRTGRKQRYQCGECGSWSLGKYEKTKSVALSSEDD